MPLVTQPFEVRDFSGGLTDEHNTIIPNQYTKMDNLLFTPEGLPFSRYGSVVYNNAQLPSGNQRVSALINYANDDTLLAISNTRLYRDNAGAWTEVVGAGGNAALAGSSTASHYQYSEYKRQGLLSSDAQIQPVKVFRDDNRGWMAVTAGLPKMAAVTNYVPATALASAITLANAIRTALLAHFASTFTHKVADTVSAAILSSGACVDLPTLVTLTNQMIRAYQNHFNDYQGASLYHTAEVGTTWTTVSDQTLASSLSSLALEDSVVLLNDLKTKYNAHWGKLDIHKANTDANNVSSPFLYGVTSGPWVDLDRNVFYTTANNLKTALLNHIQDFSTVGGQSSKAHKAVDSNNFNDVTAAANATTPETLAHLLLVLRGDYGNHELDAALATPVFHPHTEAASHKLNPFVTGFWVIASGNEDEFYGWAGGNWPKAATLLNELQTKFLAHILDAATGAGETTNAHIAGTTNYTTNSAGGFYVSYAVQNGPITLANYNYAIVYAYTYVINGLTFQTRSEPFYFSAANVISTDYEAALVQGLVSLANTGSTNYDTANITVEIYRTINNGTTYYLSGTVANGATTYTDGVRDADLISRQRLYTNSGVNPTTQPPAAKFCHIVNGAALYGNFPGSAQRIVQSTPGAIDGAFGSNNVDLPFDVQGISSFRGIPVAWTSNQTFRLEGQFDLNGNGSITAIPIASNIGLSSSFSPVVFDEGIVFAAQDGFYLTDGYRVQKISKNWRTTYLNLLRTSTTQSSILGVFERNQKRLWWVANQNSADNDSFFVLDVNFPVTQNSRFSTASNGVDFAPTAVGYFKGQIIRGDSRGYVFKHDPTYTNDPKVNTGASPTTWTTRWIPYTHQSPFYDFGTLMMRKWNPRVNVKAKNLGNLSLQVSLFTDDNAGASSNLTPLRYRGGSDIIEQRGHTPAGYLRCRNRSLQLTNAKVVIIGSDSFGLATLNQAAKTLTLGSAWPYDLVDQVVTFVNDNYTAEWAVSAQSGTVLTLLDPGGTLPASGALKWEVRGYPKDEKFQLISYALHVATLGKNQPVIGASTGANA
jgi:hypothetical protein